MSSPDDLKHEVVESEKPDYTASHGVNLHEHQDVEGYVVDAESGENVKVAEDGHTRLIPQPSDDPNDPLNWSKRRKHIALFVISWIAFLPDFGSATGAVTLLPQSAYVLVLEPR